MSSYGQLTDRVADQVVAGIKRVEGVVTTSTGKLAAKTPTLPLRRKLPLTGKLPNVREVTSANFTALERIVSAQKEYALSVLSAGTPKPAKPAPKPAAATTKARTTNRKTT